MISQHLGFNALKSVRKIALGAIVLAAFCIGSLTQPASAAPIVLFNSCAGEKPNESPWDWTFASDGGAIGSSAASTVIQHVFTNTVLFDTAVPNSDRAGYAFNSSSPFPTGMVLDREEGFALSFNFQLVNEIHTNNNSAGFNVVVMTQDGWGIELGFWNDTIFARDSTFQHAEEVDYDNRQEIQNYTLSVLGSRYCLTAPGMDHMLMGNLRQYSSSGNSFNSYESNSIFMGDNSSTAASQVYLTQVGYSFVGQLNPVPEPSSISIAILGLGMAVAFWLRQRK